jgi:hypothetical protein
MAVPALDRRDLDFAWTFDLPVRVVVDPTRLVQERVVCVVPVAGKVRDRLDVGGEDDAARAGVGVGAGPPRAG